MNLQSCLMIRCIALNTINPQELLYQLESYIEKHFSQGMINLRTNEPYWKYPECNELIYNLSNDECIRVSDLIKHFPVSWIYKDRCVYSTDFNREVLAEDAIWSQNCHSEETFLLPEVEWVQVYTWQ